MEMGSEFDGSIIDQLLDTAEENKIENDEEELEIDRKFYQKPNMATDPLQTANFLRNFTQGMMQKMGEFDTDYKLFYKPILDFGSGVGINESMRKYNLEEMNRRNQEQLRMDNISMSDNENLDFLQNFIEDRIAGAYTTNPDSRFIKDPGGSGKLIKFTMPLDLRSVEEKMQRYPFVGAEGRFRAQQNQRNSINSNAWQFKRFSRYVYRNGW